jgi:hypothetical protein
MSSFPRVGSDDHIRISHPYRTYDRYDSDLLDEKRHKKRQKRKKKKKYLRARLRTRDISIIVIPLAPLTVPHKVNLTVERSTPELRRGSEPETSQSFVSGRIGESLEVKFCTLSSPRIPLPFIKYMPRAAWREKRRGGKGRCVGATREEESQGRWRRIHGLPWVFNIRII